MTSVPENLAPLTDLKNVMPRHGKQLINRKKLEHGTKSRFVYINTFNLLSQLWLDCTNYVRKYFNYLFIHKTLVEDLNWFFYKVSELYLTFFQQEL